MNYTTAWDNGYGIGRLGMTSTKYYLNKASEVIQKAVFLFSIIKMYE